VAGAASRYARAIFEVASQDKKVDDWSKRLHTLAAAFAVPEVERAFANPTLTRDDLDRAIKALDLPQLGREGLNLLRLLVESRRTGLIDEITRQYDALGDEASGRVRATVTTAVELSAADRESLRKDLSRGLGKDVRLEAKVDPSILGGLLLRIGDRLTDASVAGRLQQLRRELATA
jgi:F-type H+-transporting ATPase subunit delta